VKQAGAQSADRSWLYISITHSDAVVAAAAAAAAAVQSHRKFHGAVAS